MKTVNGIRLVVVLAALAGAGCVAPATRMPLGKKVLSAAADLIAETKEGDLQIRCTATAYERTERKTYRFVTAAQCVFDETKVRVDPKTTKWILVFDDQNLQKPVPARILAVGNDFAVLEAGLDFELTVIPLAQRDANRGEEVMYASHPDGLGKQVFRGHVSLENLNRPVVQGSFNWTGAALCQMPVAPGSAGAAVVSVGQAGIIGILVGKITTRGFSTAVVIPISRVKQFLATQHGWKP